MTVGSVEESVAMKRDADRLGDEEGRAVMDRLPRNSPITPFHSGLYDPQPNDVPVTIVTAVILLLVLCAVSLL